MQVNVIRQKSYDFALEIIKLHRSLVNEKEFILSKQLLRSGTS
ncbi:MAG: four helix bundle protein, partial [Spirochaetales bacterium]|nr:four helix bundle protein [Spirochaetales bacterium]